MEFPKFVVGYKKNKLGTMSDDVTSITAAFFKKVLSAKLFDDTQHEIKKEHKNAFYNIFLLFLCFKWGSYHNIANL